MFIKRLYKSKKGQGLVETLIAVAIAIIVVTSLISLAVFALRNSKQASYSSQATQIAETQLEFIRAYRDHPNITWTMFGNSSNSSSLLATCLNSNASPTCANASKFCTFAKSNFSGTTPTVPTTSVNTSTSPFSYFFNLYCTTAPCNVSSGTVRALVCVSWDVGGRVENIYNYTDFTNWRLK